MRARIFKYSIAILCLGLLAFVLIAPVLSTRRWPTYEIVETLEQPVTVHVWNKDGLQLDDGRQVLLPGFVSLPISSEALNQTIRQGVEIDSKGNVYGLVKVHHWCGNDSCRNHVARVNLAHMLLFLQEGVPTRPLPQSLTGDIPLAGSNSFSEWGWNVSEYFSFQTWSRLATEQGY